LSQEFLIYERSSAEEALRQGEILSDVLQLCVDPESIVSSGEEAFYYLTHPLAIIISQECDLDLEFRARRQIPHPSGKVPDARTQIPNILFCEVFHSDDLRSQQSLNSDMMRRIKSNSDERYQYLRQVSSAEDALGEGILPLAIDFKRHFTIRADEVYARLTVVRTTKRRCRLKSPYMEQVSARFSRYLSRIALPEDH
jgi:hypothetical protein